MTREITNSDDLIDSRDVVERLEELNEMGEERDEDEDEEFLLLAALDEEASGYAPDWTYGETLIRDSYFEEYARDLAEDIGAINRDASWPNTCIDWEEAANQLQIDYTAVEFGGVTYWVR